MKYLAGSCLCGAIEYSVPDDLQYAGYCYCSECRRFSGSVLSAFGAVPMASLKVLKGAELINHYHKTAESILAFCKVCGSSLYADKPMRGMTHLRLGTLRDEPTLKPQSHSHVASKVAWYEINDGLVQHQTAPQRPSAN